MPCHPHTARRHLWPSIGISLSLYNLDNHRQRRPSPYGHPEDLSRPFEDLRGSPTTFENLRGGSTFLRSPSIPFAVLRSPSIPFEIVRSLVNPLRRSSRVYRAFAEAYDDPPVPRASSPLSSVPYGGV